MVLRGNKSMFAHHRASLVDVEARGGGNTAITQTDVLSWNQLGNAFVDHFDSTEKKQFSWVLNFAKNDFIGLF